MIENRGWHNTLLVKSRADFVSNLCDICMNLEVGRRRKLATVKPVASRSEGQLQGKEERKCEQNHTENKEIRRSHS